MRNVKTKILGGSGSCTMEEFIPCATHTLSHWANKEIKTVGCWMKNDEKWFPDIILAHKPAEQQDKTGPDDYSQLSWIRNQNMCDQSHLPWSSQELTWRWLQCFSDNTADIMVTMVDRMMIICLKYNIPVTWHQDSCNGRCEENICPQSDVKDTVWSSIIIWPYFVIVNQRSASNMWYLSGGECYLK